MSRGRKQYYEEGGFYVEKRPFRPIRTLLVLVLSLILLAGIAGGIYSVVVVSRAEAIDPREQFLQLQMRASYASLDHISKPMQQAIVAIEDKRFYSHHGIDYLRLGAALLYDIRHRTLEQGGSTLSMQLSKMWYTNSKKDLQRKVLDIWYARSIEKALSKEEILEAYLNTAGFSQGTVGIEEASQHFFGKKAKELDLAEASLLAGVVNRSEKYTPWLLEELSLEDRPEFLQTHIELIKQGPLVTEEQKVIYEKLFRAKKISSLDYSRLMERKAAIKKYIVNPEAKKRQELILKIMLEQKIINERQYGIAMNENLVFRKSEK